MTRRSLLELARAALEAHGVPVAGLSDTEVAERAGAALPVERTRCISLIAAEGLTAKRRAAARIELPAEPRAQCAAASPTTSVAA